MPRKSVNISSSLGLLIRTITPADLENMRQWKNAHRHYFFHQQEIQPAQQLQWHAGYEQRPDDYMFIVEADGRDIGCMGIRWTPAGWDVYNVILGHTAMAGRGLMGRAFQLMLAFARKHRPDAIKLQVLKKNPAIGWYEKNGFHIVADGGDHLAMLHGADRPAAT